MRKVLIIGTGNIAIRHFQNILKLKITNQIKILSRFSSARNISKNVAVKIPAHNIPAFKPAKVFLNGVKTKVKVA